LVLIVKTAIRADLLTDLTFKPDGKIEQADFDNKYNRREGLNINIMEISHK